MTIHSGIFNSVNGDRKYDAQFFAQYFASFIGNGIFPNPSTNLQVIANQNMITTVKAGKGWINGYYIYNDSDFVLQHDIADGILKRIDRVVMRLNYLTRQIEIVIKKGTNASSPVAPNLQRDTDYVELALADVLINNGATVITQANITDHRLNTVLCGIVHGVVDQVDTTTIFNQYQSWFNQMSVNKLQEMDDFKNALELSLNQWMTQEQSDFNVWFASIQNILDGNVAATLATRMTNLEQNVGEIETSFTQHEEQNIAHNHYAVATGTNTLTLTISGITSLVAGLSIRFKNTTANTAAVTLNVNQLGAKSVVKSAGTVLVSGNLKAGGLYTVVYDGTSFFLQGEGGEYGTATASHVLSGYTLGTESGVVSGTITTKAVATITPGTSNQTIAAGQYLSGAQTILGDADLVPSNIKAGVDIFGVLGTVTDGSNMLKMANGTGYAFSNYFTVSGLSFEPKIIIVIQKANKQVLAIANTFSNPGGIFYGDTSQIWNVFDSGNYINSNGFRVRINNFGELTWYVFG